MSKALRRWPIVVGTAAVISVLAATTATAATATGPSTVTPPYVLPVASGVTITSLLTVDDAGKASNGYEMVGIPDGLGARRTGETVTVFMNHELGASQGIVRRHGQQGAFVSELTLNRQTNEVVSGRDLINPGVQYWNYLTGSYSATPNGPGTQSDGDVFPAYDPRFGRFCSGRLTEPGQLFNFLTLTGYRGQLYFANEEIGDEGRNFAVTTDGQATQLPRLGLFSWENTLLAANRSNTTLVMGNEDGSDGQLRAYVGTKQRTGSPVDQAGLTNGRNSVIDLVDETISTDAQFRTTFGKGTPARFDLSEIDWNQSGADQNLDAKANGLSLNRIEDGAFDPRRPNDYYFVTTSGGNGPGGGLWRLRWDNIENPAAGGTLTLLLDGSEGLFSPDNIDVDSKGNVVIQEDPGNNAHVATIMAYRISDGALGTLATFDPAQFVSGGAGFITQDEESSGIIDVARVYRTPSLAGLPFFIVQDLEASGLFDLLDISGASGTFLFDAQVHTAPVNNAAEYVERGQLMRMKVDNWNAVYGS